MKHHSLSTFFGPALLLALLFIPVTTNADYLRCPNANAVITFSEPADADTACTGASDASAFLKANGFSTGRSVKINMVALIPEKSFSSAFGCFDHRQGQIHILKFSSCQERKKIFRLPMDPDLHRSIVVHEVAHAIASQNLPEKRAFVTQEYIAYVTQLATMPQDVREKVLANFPYDGFDSDEQINMTFFMMAPEVFAVKAYRHFLRPENGAAFFRRLLLENFLTDQESD